MSLDSDKMEIKEQKSHICKICNESFGTKHYLSFHMTKAHPNIFAFECDTCHKTFKLEINLEIHKSTCKPEEPEEYTPSATDTEDTESSQSEKRSGSKRKEKKSKEKNKEKKPRRESKKTKKNEQRETETIDEMFKKPQSEFVALRERKELERVPDGIEITWTPEIIDGKTYQRCSFCKKLLENSVKHRKVHKDRHLGIKRHVCEYCGAGFTTEDAFNRHIRTHTNEKPFACKYCPERFTCPQTLKFHTRAHSSIKLYQCEHCKEKFIRYCAMQCHIINKHIL